MITPPQNEAELLARANAIAGLTLGQMAAAFEQIVPPDLRREKGWVGQLLEKILGADAANLAEPDFQQLGIEMKTLPLNAAGFPRESTYVCTVSLSTLQNQVWETSTVFKKLRHVLWIPIEADPAIPLAYRRIACPILWRPTKVQARRLQEDWEEFAELISLGQIEQITAHRGTSLQIRPKAAHSRVRCKGTGETGEAILTMPRGFYLRASFTTDMLRDCTKILPKSI